jgi:hypothetical protein
MEIQIPLFEGFSLKFSDALAPGTLYPTSQLQKGFLLFSDRRDLTEEAVGFGVPVLKRGLQTIFPGRVEFTAGERGRTLEIGAIFSLNLEERISRHDSSRVRNKLLYQIKNILAESIRLYPALRGALTASSSALRGIFGWSTVYEDVGNSPRIKMVYAIEKQSGKMAVTVDLDGPDDAGITEVVVMNEQGANYFTQYRDSSGLFLEGKKVGTWDEVAAREAAFINPIQRIAFKLQQAEGAKLYRGRELVGSRLAWSGFGYIYPPTARNFRYELILERLP